MSRGPGKIERAVAAVFDSEPDTTFTLSELAQRVYGAAEKKHRVAVGRVAAKLSPARVHRFKPLYPQDVPYWTKRNVKAVEAALQECSQDELLYLFSEVLPVFRQNVLRRGA